MYHNEWTEMNGRVEFRSTVESKPLICALVSEKKPPCKVYVWLENKLVYENTAYNTAMGIEQVKEFIQEKYGVLVPRNITQRYLD